MPAAASAQPHQRHPRRDPADPGGERAAFFVLRQRLGEPHEEVVHEVLRVRAALQQERRTPQQQGGVLFVQVGECGGIAPPRGSDEVEGGSGGEGNVGHAFIIADRRPILTSGGRRR